MNMFDPFDPMSPFFQDEFIFNENDEPKQKGQSRRSDGDSCYFRICPDCNRILTVYRSDEVIRCDCGSRFRNE